MLKIFGWYMKANRNLTILAAAMVLAVLGVVTGCSPHEGRAAEAQKKSVYTCPMHPEIRQSAPGACPKCGMKLVVAASASQSGCPAGGGGGCCAGINMSDADLISALNCPPMTNTVAATNAPH